ncbi:protein kinase, putative [Leishmania tarentolae]|uniref:non-specific serine/threonine protein kinase n=1 Tax=Leishmania tarentolae TaxID=5689 RepID=A0A640KQK5_LEITA|nr:protein kinase, putative [Leishmania tarentolae]
MFSSTNNLSSDTAVASELPPSPRPRTPSPPIVPSASHSSMPSTAATQIVSRGVSSTPPLATEVDICGPFLLYDQCGRLLGRYEPSDLWGLLISEHTALNCTYAQTTVRIGRAGGCDTVLSDPRVSSTHFTIALELEPHGNSDHRNHRRGNGVEGNAAAHVFHEKRNSWNADNSESGTGSDTHEIPLRQRRSPEGSSVNIRGMHASTNISVVQVPESATPGGLTSSSSLLNPVASEKGLNKGGQSNEKALSGATLPAWRVRRVLLADCSANGTYVNDVLVGRGECCELHYGDDISIVRVSEKKRPRRGSTTPTDLSSEEDEVESFAQGERARKLRHGAAAVSSFPSQHVALSRDTLAGGGAVSMRTEVNEEGSSPSSDDRHVTQMFTALLSTLSTEHTYVERFCFHFYHAEEVGRGGIPITESDTVDASRKIVAGEVEAEEERHGKGNEESDKYDAVLQQPQPDLTHSLSHLKSVRFPDDPVTVFDPLPQNTDCDGTESPLVSLSALQYDDQHASLSTPPIAPCALVPGDTTISAAFAPQSSAGSLRTFSTVVTPHFLLRPRPSIRESFIAPISLPDSEASVQLSNEAMHGSVTTSSPAIRFHESIGISPALQRNVAAQRALAARRGGSIPSNQTNGSLGTFGAIMKDMPADIPVRYAVLPLRHLQWGGRIGFGASGDVFMGIDVSTATVVAIKVLKGSSLFQSSQPADAEMANAHSKTALGRPAVPSVRDDSTILNLSNISLGNGTVVNSRAASKGSVFVPQSSGSPITTPSHRETSLQLDHVNEESIQASEASTPQTPASAATSSSASAHGNASTALVKTSSSSHCPTQLQQQQEPPRSQPQDEHSALPLLRKHLREIIFLTTLQHHRIVRFLGFQFNGEGRLCLLMEYVAGGTLQTLVKNFGVFEENVIRLYTLQILEGLEYLKRKGVVHGDLKSANILVSEQGSVKLTDFGTSRFLREYAAEETGAREASGADKGLGAEMRRDRRRDKSREVHHAPEDRARRRYHNNSPNAEEAAEDSRGEEISVGNTERCRGWCRGGRDGIINSNDVHTAEDEEGEEPSEDDSPGRRLLCGTPLYMSPELIRTQEPTFASDMWALGCVVYEMSTGGILPWRPVHNHSAPAVIWYIGQRGEEGDGPSMDDVFTERNRLNHASTSPSLHEALDDSYVEECGGRHGHSARGGSAGHWNRTPSPMLLDLLQSTLNMNPALRPTPAELLQHPFIRNEASDAALEHWHTLVEANRRPAIHALKQHGEEEKELGLQRSLKSEPVSAIKSTLRSVRGNTRSASRHDSLSARASLSPARTSPSPEVIHKMLDGNAFAKLAGENPRGIESKQPHPSLHPPPPLGESMTPLSANLLGNSWDEVEPSPLLPPPPTASQPERQAPRARSVQAPSVLGAGNPDSQPLIYEPPQRLDVRKRRINAPQPAIRQTSATSELLPSAPYGAASVPWWTPQRFSAPVKIPASRSHTSVAAPMGMRQAEQQIPYTMPVAQQSASKSYLRQHQLFLKQNEIERRRLSFLTPQGGRQMRGRHRIEGPSTLQQQLPVPMASAQVASRMGTMHPPSYQYAMQQPVLECTPGYSDYNPQVNTQTVEMRLPPGFTSQSLSVSQQQGRRQSGSSGSKRVVAGVQLQNVPSSQQLRGNKPKHNSRRERARNAATIAAAVNVSASLHPNSRSPVTSMNSSHSRGTAAATSARSSSGPVLSHTSRPFAPPQQQASMQPLYPIVGGLTMEIDNLTISSPLLSSFAASMAPLPVERHSYVLGHSSAPMSVDQPASKSQQTHSQGPVFSLPSDPHHRHTALAQSTTASSFPPGSGGGGSAVQQTSPTNTSEVERAGTSAAQRKPRRGRQGRRNALFSSSLLHQSRLRNQRYASQMLRQQLQQISLERFHTCMTGHCNTQEHQKLSRLNDEAPASQQKEEPSRAKRRIRTSLRVPTRESNRRRQRRRSQKQRAESPEANAKQE